MADDDKDLWNSANDTSTEAPPAPETTPEPAPEPSRDERGRFAAKVEETANPQPETPVEQPTAPQQPEPQREDHGIPSWRLKEEADAKREALERAQRYEREVEQMRRELAAMQRQNEPKPEVPQIWDNPDGYFDHRSREAIDPVKSEISQLREFYSQRDAVRTHGVETVKAAYSSLDQAARSGDPEALAVVARVKQSLDPYGDMVTWHKKQTIFSTIGDNPDAFVEKQLEEKLKDPAYQAKLLERIRGQAQQRPSTVTPLPPSLNRAAAAMQPVEDDDGGEAGLLRNALRR
jgi:hypothetical protein